MNIDIFYGKLHILNIDEFLPWLNKCTVMKNSHSWSQECCCWIFHVVFSHNSTESILQNSAIQPSKCRLLDLHPHIISLSIFARFLQNILSHLICQQDLLGDDIFNLIWQVTVWMGRRLSIWKFWNLLPEEIIVQQFLAKSVVFSLHEEEGDELKYSSCGQTTVFRKIDCTMG